MEQPRVPDSPDDNDLAGQGDRREGGRYRTVCRIAKILRDGDAGLWRVRNISDGGMMLAADVSIAVGERLQIALSDNVVLSARVVWSDNGRCGVAFDEEVDGAAVLKQLAAEQRDGEDQVEHGDDAGHQERDLASDAGRQAQQPAHRRSTVGVNR